MDNRVTVDDVGRKVLIGWYVRGILVRIEAPSGNTNEVVGVVMDENGVEHSAGLDFMDFDEE